MAAAYHFAASLYYRHRETAAVQAQAEALIHLATAQTLPLWIGFGTCWRGWAMAMQGQHETGLALMQQGVEAGQSRGQTLTRSLWLVLLAEITAHLGQVEDGLYRLEEAFVGFEATARGDWLGEAYRLQGEWFLQHDPSQVARAEASFQQALDLACRQQAKSLELRAAVSFSRLRQRQGRLAGAHECLAPVYNWFNEGFDTQDLQAARALLEALER